MKQVKHFMKDSFMNFGVFLRLNFILTTKVKTNVEKPQSLAQITNFLCFKHTKNVFRAFRSIFRIYLWIG